MKTPLVLIALLTGFLGCAPSSNIQKSQDLPPVLPSTVSGEQIVSKDTLTKKINVLNAFLKDDNIVNETRMIISTLKNNYEVMREALGTTDTGQPPAHALRDFLSGLEKANDSFISSRASSRDGQRKVIEKLSKGTKDIMRLYRKGDTKAVIAGCDFLQTEYGPDAFTIDLTAALALSLAREGRMQEAIALGDAAAKAIKEADEFCNMPDRIKEWKAALNPEQEASGEPIEQRRLRKILAQAESLSGQGEFDRARELLITGRGELKDDALLYQIDKALEKVEEQREGFLEERIALISKRGEIIAEARDLISREMPDEALARIKPLDSGDAQPDLELRAVKAEAIEQIISRERNRAARLFLQAKETGDAATREKLLRSSYGTLKGLIEQYPDSPSVKKITENMHAVQKEMAAIKSSPINKP